MSGSTYNSRSNEISKAYYFFLKGAINDGIIKANVYSRTQQDGQEIYFMD